jgi:isopentenyl diphosphate isomerase/L-lactate dehydrogenase-like FMN-dependent dehydrogenase
VETLLNVDDYRRVARRRLPRVVFDYVDGGAEAELTLAANARAFEEVALRPRGGTRPEKVSIETTVLGVRCTMPILVAPCGGARLVRPVGDLAGARAAARSGTVFCLSGMSNHALEEVTASSPGPVWFQLYHLGSKELTEAVVDRAAKAGVGALVVTVDCAASSVRERDKRNGVPELLGRDRLRALPYLPQLLARPLWLAGRLADVLVPELGNVVGPDGMPRVLGRDFIPRSCSFADLAWVRERFAGPIVVKGVLTPDDASQAVDAGASAVVVSNHGGRQLDGAEATLRALPDVVAAVGDRCEVLLDGGVRRGTDVLKAVALGAKAVLIGRPWLWGLAAGGEAGVIAVLELLRDGVARNLALLGCEELAELSPRYVRLPAGWSERA